MSGFVRECGVGIPILRAWALVGEFIDDLRSITARDREWYAPLRELSAEEVAAGLMTGTVVNAWDGDGEPLRIPVDEEVSGAFLDTPVPTARVDAQLLADVLRAFSGGEGADARGLRLHQVVIVGTVFPGGRGSLNLNSLDVPFAIGFTGCVFVGGLWAMRVNIRRLSFDTCAFLEARTGIVLDESRIPDGIGFFHVEGLTQFMATDSQIGTLRLSADDLDLPDDPTTFRTVLAGTTIGTLYVDGEDEPVDVLPAGSCEGFTVERIVMAGTEERRSDHLWKADWMAAWLSSGRPPRFPLGSWRERNPEPHARSAWDSIATAMSRAGYESARGARYIDQGTRLRLLGERHRDSKLRFLPRVVRWLSLDVSTAYFSQNLRALGWLVVCWLVVAVLAWVNIHDLWRPTDAAGLAAPAGPLEAGVDGVGWALTYGLDLVVSPLDLGFDAVWPTSIGLLSAFAAVKLVSLALFGLFVFGLTSVLERAGRRA